MYYKGKLSHCEAAQPAHPAESAPLASRRLSPVLPLGGKDANSETMDRQREENRFDIRGVADMMEPNSQFR